MVKKRINGSLRATESEDNTLEDLKLFQSFQIETSKTIYFIKICG